MQIFLNRLHDEFRDDILVVVCDGAAWHKSSKLEVPENMTILHIPPYTPEMNPIEQIWRELRTQGFRNEVFATLEKVVNRLCETIRHLSKIQSSVLLVGNGFGAFLIGNSIRSGVVHLPFVSPGVPRNADIARIFLVPNPIRYLCCTVQIRPFSGWKLAEN